MMPVATILPASPRLVSVILPTYNERENIVPLVQGILDSLAGFRIEVLVVDDDSPDGTAEAVRQAFAEEIAVRVLVRSSERGFAKSIRTGIQESRGDVIIVMDSDGNHQPRYLPFMVEAIRYYDCVMGSRFVYGGRMLPWSRSLLSWIFNLFVRSVTASKITDNLYGLFAIRAEHLRRCDRDEIFHGFGEYSIRLLHRLQQLGLSILQFPAVNGDRLKGTGNRRFIKTFAIYLAATWRLVFRKGRLKHVQDTPGLPDLQQPTVGIDPSPGKPGSYGTLPNPGREDLRRSA